MLFNSIDFLLFFVVVTTLYFLLPHAYRWILLLGASIFFYLTYIPLYILVLFWLIVVDYFAGLFIFRTKKKGRKKVILILSLLSTCASLVFFKYVGFLATTVNDLAALFHLQYSLPVLQILIPIGLSFHTFQSMSYVIEVYRGGQKPQRHFGKYALYVLFYPQLVAGPIERPQHLMPQFDIVHRFEYARVMSGLQLMLWGLFKKMVIADNLAYVVDAFVPSMPTQIYFNSYLVMLGIFFFAFQIYCDFSGYSDMAVGIARVMGFSLTQNFRRPYFSKSITEFWRRWHISLFSWFKDYVYIPLGGNRVSKRRWIFIVFFVFFLSGLWHGANWTFIFWGVLNGFFIVMEDMVRSYFPMKIHSKIRGFISIIWTFSLCCLAWTFFRIPDIRFLGTFFSFLLEPTHFYSAVMFISQDIPYFAFSLVVLLICVEYMQEKNIVNIGIFQEKWFVFFLYILVALSIFVVGVFDEKTFIYFQF